MSLDVSRGERELEGNRILFRRGCETRYGRPKCMMIFVHRYILAHNFPTSADVPCAKQLTRGLIKEHFPLSLLYISRRCRVL